MNAPKSLRVEHQQNLGYYDLPKFISTRITQVTGLLIQTASDFANFPIRLALKCAQIPFDLHAKTPTQF